MFSGFVHLTGDCFTYKQERCKGDEWEKWWYMVNPAYHVKIHNIAFHCSSASGVLLNSRSKKILTR